MTRREIAQMVLGLISLGGTAGCGGGMNEGENALATTPTLRIRIRLNNGVEKTIKVPRGSTVLAAISCKPFYYHQNDDGTTVIKGICGHWRYTVNGSEPRYETGQHYRIYAGKYRLTSNCRLDLRLI